MDKQAANNFAQKTISHSFINSSLLGWIKQVSIPVEQKEEIEKSVQQALADKLIELQIQHTLGYKPEEQNKIRALLVEAEWEIIDEGDDEYNWYIHARPRGCASWENAIDFWHYFKKEDGVTGDLGYIVYYESPTRKSRKSEATREVIYETFDEYVVFVTKFITEANKIVNSPPTEQLVTELIK